MVFHKISLVSLLILLLVLLLRDVSCNHYSNESAKLSKPSCYNYNMKVTDMFGNRLVVGTRCTTRTGNNSSNHTYSYTYQERVDIYRNVNNTWITEFEISNLSPNITSVHAVAISDNYMAYISKTNNSLSLTVYNYVNATWSKQSHFSIVPDGYNCKDYGLSVNNDTLVVYLRCNNGSNDAMIAKVDVAQYTGTSWSVLSELLSSFNLSLAHSRDIAVDMDGHRIVIGGTFHNLTSGIYSGAFYIFKRDNNSWVKEVFVVLSNGENASYSGSFVAISGNRVAVGQHDKGNVYVYQFVNGSWIRETKLVPSGGQPGDNFGYAVSLYGNYLLVGSKNNDAKGNDSGVAYLYKYSGNTWVNQVQLINSDGGINSYFGSTVAIDGSKIAVGKGWYSGSSNASIYTYSINDIGNSSHVVTDNSSNNTAAGNSSSNSSDVTVGNYTGHHMILRCNDNNMTGYWSRSSFQGKNISITTSDPSCNHTKSNSSMIWITLMYSRCGTTIEEDQSNINVKNTAMLNVRNNTVNSTVYTYQYNMFCLFSRVLKHSLFNGYNISSISGNTFNTTISATDDSCLCKLQTIQ